MPIRSAMGMALSVILMSTSSTAHNVGCLAGDEVDAVWSGDGHHHRATIYSINLDDTITVHWDEKEKNPEQVPWDGVLLDDEVCSRPQECFVGDVVKAVADDHGERWKATIQSIASDGTMTVKWDDPDPDEAKTAQLRWDRVEKNNIVCAPPSPPPSPPPPPPSPPPGSIVSTLSGKCLSLPSVTAVNGDYLLTWDCDGSAGQKWAWDDYVIYWDGGLVWTHCLDVPGGDTTNGNGLWIWQCLGLPQQQWSRDAATGSIFLGEGSKSTCIDLRNGGVDAGTAVQIWDCADGYSNMNQMWELGSSSEAQFI